jgi:hypothetical protein
MKTITICSSASFYEQAVKVQSEVRNLGFECVIPANAEKMKELNDFDVSHYKTWTEDSDDYSKKTKLMTEHFKAISKGDAILVLNYEKHGVSNYIGGNVLIEMGIALYLNKVIFILNEAPKDSSFLEEILGVNPIILHGNINNLS